MRPEITLSYYDEAGRLRRVRVESLRFSIGRIPDNDLMIEHSSLSRRHALIESFDDSVQISDCGSQNGTFLNGAQVTFPVELHDNDVINLGDACEVTVEFASARVAQAVDVSSQTASSSSLSREDLLRSIEAGLAAQKTPTVSRTPNAREPKVPFESSASPPGLNMYIIAPVIAVVILALVVVAAVALKGSGSRRGGGNRSTDKNQERVTPPVDETSNNLPRPSPEQTVSDNPPAEGSEELEEVERNALAVMRSISKSDPNPVLTEQNVKEINERIKTYKGSAALRDNLRTLKGRIQQLNAMAKSDDVKPAFLAFSALAKMDKEGSRGDPLAVAQGALPGLAKARVVHGDELAHDALLTLIATDSSTGGAIALRDSVSDLTKRRPDASASAIRNIWFLRENQRITPQAYDLALRFLAIGAIAQNPRKYGIEAEPLTF
ncbi:MAG: FHA domain-containing protein [Pyrinomonadaceae bacterium]|nr:FHA domain-containing protein [Pyrinomonadaceae bacterium]